MPCVTGFNETSEVQPIHFCLHSAVDEFENLLFHPVLLGSSKVVGSKLVLASYVPQAAGTETEALKLSSYSH